MVRPHDFESFAAALGDETAWHSKVGKLLPVRRNTGDPATRIAAWHRMRWQTQRPDAAPTGPLRKNTGETP
jgi:hypothetical protein